MKAVLWSNGTIDAAPTWRELLNLVRKAQWNEYDDAGFRAEMAKRAMRWSGVEIDVGAAPVRFFRELERAKLIYILEV